MKCPKCGYLGFETTERCRNCGYDFSLAVPQPTTDLPLGRSETDTPPLGDLTLHEPPAGSSVADVHDRDTAGFGRVEPRRTTPPRPAPSPPEPEDDAEPAVEPAMHLAPGPVSPGSEDLPLFSPRPAGTPLAVRRTGHEVPKARRSSSRQPRVAAPELPLAGTDAPPTAPVVVRPARARVPEAASARGRVAAAFIDLTCLVSVDFLTLWLTLRMAGLEASTADLAVIRPVPMVAFFLVLAFLYLVGFTLGGGQTIGKMALGIRVTGDDGRGVDITGAVVRALGCLLSIATLGLLFVPVFLSADRRAVHDRLAGTRVVIG